jgi:hypothetical protein
MKRSLKSIVTISALFALVASPILGAKSASANPESYVGAGVSAGLTNGGQDGDAATLGGNIQGRYALPNAPISVRGAVIYSDETSAIMPIVSYDVPVNDRVNVYAGGGYSMVESDGKPTPMGNKDSVVLTTGVEAKVTRDIVLYGDAKLGLDAYKDSPASALSVNVGAGYAF